MILLFITLLSKWSATTYSAVLQSIIINGYRNICVLGAQTLFFLNLNSNCFFWLRHHALWGPHFQTRCQHASYFHRIPKFCHELIKCSLKDGLRLQRNPRKLFTALCYIPTANSHPTPFKAFYENLKCRDRLPISVPRLLLSSSCPPNIPDLIFNGFYQKGALSDGSRAFKNLNAIAKTSCSANETLKRFWVTLLTCVLKSIIFQRSQSCLSAT